MSPDSLAPAEAPARPSYIAPLLHTLSFLLLLGFLAALDVQHAQNAQHLQDAGSTQATVSTSRFSAYICFQFSTNGESPPGLGLESFSTAYACAI
jgi:hypothetical protein